MVKIFLKNRVKISLPSRSRNTICGICGRYTDCYDILKKTFTNLDELYSRYICADCAPLFSIEWLKTGFYFTQNEMHKMKQHEYEYILFNQCIEFPCMISFSESRKKHRLYRTKISTSLDQVNLSTDMGNFIFNINPDSYDNRVFWHLANMYNDYKISKSWLIDGFPMNAIYKTIGLKKYKELMELIHPIRWDYKLNLIVKFLNKWTK